MLDPITREKQILIWEKVFQAINSALDRLHFVAVAIRKASAKQVDETIANSVTEEDIIFRKTIVTLVRYKFPAVRKGLCQQLGDSIADRRQQLLYNGRHAKKLAARRVREDLPATKQHQDTTPKSTPAMVPIRDRISHRPVMLASEGTKASRPNPDSPELRHLQLPKRQALTTVISTISTTQEDYIDYPPAPVAKPGTKLVQCPFCLVPLDRSQMEHKSSDYWTRHVDEHLKPYSCLFPKCAKTQTCFTRRKEWKAHMEVSHSKDWLRKVHTIVWYCDLDHEFPETFETELQWKKHMEDLASHPQRKLNVPTRAQLDALSPRKQQVAMRNEYVCPLCEQVPKKILPLVESKKGQPSEMYDFVVDHVADHLKSLSLMALPSFGDTAQEVLETSGESVVWPNESHKRLLNENSIPHPPSGAEHISRFPFPSETWSSVDRDNAPSFTKMGANSYWDKEYVNYSHPEIPPEQLEQAWLTRWNLWKSANDPFSHHTFETDPVVSHLIEAKGDNLSTAQTPTSFLFVINELPINDDPSRGGIQPRSDPMGYWLPPIYSAGFGPQRPGRMYRWSDGTITDVYHRGYQWYNGGGWQNNYGVSTPLTYYETTSLFWCNDFTQFLMLEDDVTTKDMEPVEPPYNYWYPLTFHNTGKVSRIGAPMDDQYLIGNKAWWIERLGLKAYRSLERNIPLVVYGLGGRIATIFALVAFSCRNATELRTILTSHEGWCKKLRNYNTLHGSMLLYSILYKLLIWDRTS
jgi:hypothetical protein